MRTTPSWETPCWCSPTPSFRPVTADTPLGGTILNIVAKWRNYDAADANMTMAPCYGRYWGYTFDF